jgi:hypothetical protein
MPPCVSNGQSFTVEWADIPYYTSAPENRVNGVGGVGGGGIYNNGGNTNQVACDLGGQCSQGVGTNTAYNGETCHFELTLYSNGHIKFQYKDMVPSPNAWAPPSVGVENAAGSEGMQISYGDPTFPKPNSAYMFADTCGRSKTMVSLGWCPLANTAACDGCATAGRERSCDFAYADQFCQDNYGGQLVSLEDQADYDRIAALIPNDATAPNGGAYQQAFNDEKYMTGMHSDGNGGWEYTDGTPADLTFLRAHAQDQLAGHAPSINLVYTSGYDHQGAENPSCNPATGCALHDCCGGSAINGFICEFYGAPGAVGLALGRKLDDAENHCQEQYGGHLLSIHDQQGYDRLAKLATGYGHPILIGLKSDAAGNWEWMDKSPVDMTFLKAHSADQLAGTDETQAAFYPPTYSADPNEGLHDWYTQLRLRLNCVGNHMP